MPRIDSPVCRYAPTCALLASLLTAAPLHAQSDARIWGSVVTTDGEVHQGFLRFRGDQNAASWTDTFQSLQDIGLEPRDTWLDASRGRNPFMRTIELKGYRISWNDRSHDFPEQRTIRVRFGSIRAIVVSEDAVEIVLRGGAAGTEEATGRGGTSVWSGASGRLLGGKDEDWGDTRIDVDRPGRGRTTVSADDVGRIELAAAPSGREASSAQLAGSVEDRSGRTFRGFITWDDRAVLQSDTLRGRLGEGSPPTILFADIRSIARRPVGAIVTLASGDTVDLAGGINRRRNPASQVVVVDPDIGTVTIRWREFSALHLDREEPGTSGQPGGGAAPNAASYDNFDAGTLLRGVVVTHDGEEIEGRIRWSALKEWSWDRLYADADVVGFAVEFGSIRSIEQLAFRDVPSDRLVAEGAQFPGRALVTLLDGSAYEMSGSSDLGSRNWGILVRTTAPEGEPDPASGSAPDAGDDTGAARDSAWRFVAWEDVREVRFDHSRSVDPGA